MHRLHDKPDGLSRVHNPDRPVCPRVLHAPHDQNELMEVRHHYLPERIT